MAASLEKPGVAAFCVCGQRLKPTGRSKGSFRIMHSEHSRFLVFVGRTRCVMAPSL